MQEFDPYTRSLLEISDKIAEISRRKLARAKLGQPRDEADEQLLAKLTAQMNRSRYAASEQHPHSDQASA